MSKRGSLFVETAIVLPLFLLAVLSISILIRITAVEENTMRCFSEEAQKTLKEAYLTQLDLLPGQFDMDFSDPSDSYDSIQQKGKTGISEALVHGALLEFRIQSRLKEETVSLKDASLNRFEYLYSDGEASGLIHCGFKYGVELPLPLDFHRQLQFEQRLLFRGFIGADENGEGMGFEAMETQDDANTVYVFPRAGERFHKSDCRIIEVYPKEMVLSPSVRKKYTPCKICDAEDLPYGFRVYCFDTSGKAFHRGSCSTVDRFVIGIDGEEAMEQGYTPCYYCRD